MLITTPHEGGGRRPRWDWTPIAVPPPAWERRAYRPRAGVKIDCLPAGGGRLRSPVKRRDRLVQWPVGGINDADLSGIFAFFAARFSFKVLPCFLILPLRTDSLAMMTFSLQTEASPDTGPERAVPFDADARTADRVRALAMAQAADQRRAGYPQAGTDDTAASASYSNAGRGSTPARQAPRRTSR
jgi:hypothetical protein